MANKRLDYDKLYKTVIQCRTSGLTDRQWCQQQGLSFNTFYSWVKRLREAACYEIPEQPKGSRKTTSITEQHEVVRVDIQSPMLKQEIVTSNTKKFQYMEESTSPMIGLDYRGVHLQIPDEFNEQTLSRVLRTIGELQC